MKKLIVIIAASLLLFSCANIFNSIVFPNQCQKCEVINTQTGEVLFANEGCGGDNTKLEDEAKIKAFDLSSGSFGICDLEVKCKMWKKGKDSEN